jgi:hypothetical protein
MGVLRESSFPMLLLVRSAILRSVCLKMLVMDAGSFPPYVKMAHFGGGCGMEDWVGFGLQSLCGFMGKTPHQYPMKHL